MERQDGETALPENTLNSIPDETRIEISLNKLIDSNGDNFKKIKASLALMKIDIKDCEATQKSEPETRVKKTIHHTFMQKFRDVLRTS